MRILSESRTASHRRIPLYTAVAYDPAKRRLEVFYKWKTGSQYYPISPGMFQQIERAANIHELLGEWIKQRRIRWDEVRTEGRLVVEMLCGVQLVVDWGFAALLIR